ncbi:putative metal-dependent phosphohydrolase [Thermoclostridium stercorarium subsp. stercorarium DSM 8532]|uniref:5'-deoxynucleotidase n=2 Tax=Thermoclostridium stercorarium TaxID=1510 RepID=L7VPP2_THES1|nr:HD domain-containing protein [Thermoclostridium stercorarium]AGC68416.1 putative metal-dependent phosphohydrolase [Thermoclostridium stercorarium subsp. stercorarium DSM 8532]AGI39436.1 hydrolase [Thermoclostridium stercorarium subsp. stercorarium DSM 8532]ANW98790.1 phosphohydrolase [Thermoclostridium stercorarium subsp. thermolacticum DSM 2910]
MDKLRQQISFIVEIDKLKNIYRQSYLTDGSRHENDAEHSWHLAVMAFILAEYADEKVDLLKVIKMVLVHDLVEIDAGDTYCYDERAMRDKKEREEKCAKRLFSMLPDEQRNEMYELWEEFERMETPEARYAAALDRLQPVLLNYFSGGKSWKEHGIYVDQVLNRNGRIKDSSQKLWEFVESLLHDAVEKGYLKKS